MKTKIIALLFTFVCCQGILAEYAVIDRIVYELNLDNLTATVLNFQTSTYDLVSVTIPEQIVYKGDTYEITCLSYNGFDYDALNDYVQTAEFLGRAPSSYFADKAQKREKLERKFKYEYAEARANIEFLYLPNTLKTISDGAFKGMTRLKRLSIPARVHDFSKYCFNSNSRLENITFEGVPHLCHIYVTGKDKNNPWWLSYDTICLDDSNNPLTVLDSLQLKKEWQYSCPKLQAIEFLLLKDYIFYINKLDKSYSSYSKRLSDSVSVYKLHLTRHPYYIEDNYFSKIAIQKPILTSTRVKENYTTQSTALRKEYNRQLTLCRKEYKTLWNNMEQNCKLKKPSTYVDRYCELHPEFSARVDSMLEDYKCRHTKQSLASLILQNAKLGKTCQDSLWAKYAYLYKSKEDFLLAYTLSPDINIELAQRNSIYNNLRSIIYTQDLKVKGIYNKDSWPAINFKMKYDLMTKNEIPVSVLIIEKDPKALKEFEKNGQYFDTPDEFFAAYIRSNYSNILKSKKKSKNK